MCSSDLCYYSFSFFTKAAQIAAFDILRNQGFSTFKTNISVFTQLISHPSTQTPKIHKNVPKGRALFLSSGGRVRRSGGRCITLI